MNVWSYKASTALCPQQQVQTGLRSCYRQTVLATQGGPAELAGLGQVEPAGLAGRASVGPTVHHSEADLPVSREAARHGNGGKFKLQSLVFSNHCLRESLNAGR